MFRTIQVHVIKKDNQDLLHLALKRAEICKLYPGMWQIVTGSVEPDEHAFAAAKRELSEETGIQSDSWYKLPFLGGFYDIKRNSVEGVPAFAVILSGSNSISLSEEHSEYKWLRIEELEEYMPIPDHIAGSIRLEKLISNQEHLEIFRI